MPLAIVMKKDL